LDVATGGGHTALKFAPHVVHVIASDITPKMLNAARVFITERNMHNITFELADAEDLPFEDGAFDLLTCRIAPHHFADCVRFVREGARVLKPGGMMLAQDHVLPEDAEAAAYINRFERLRDPSHNRAYTASEWKRMFAEAGLTVTHTEQLAKQLGFVTWTARQARPPEVVARLRALLREAPAPVAAWLQPQDIDTPEATFSSHHIIIAGRRL
jgi:ubiquinone/menaquinone biosynthesis C-methylase UbiE